MSNSQFDCNGERMLQWIVAINNMNKGIKMEYLDTEYGQGIWQEWTSNEPPAFDEYCVWREKKETEEPDDQKIFLVETITTMRHRYLIKAKELSHAYDEFVCRGDTLTEFSQLFIDENIMDGREVSMKEIEQLMEGCDIDSDSKELGSPWVGLERLLNEIDYSEVE